MGSIVGRSISSLTIALLLLSILSSMINIEPVDAVWSGGPIYIRADGSIEPSDATIKTSDYITYILTDDIKADTDGIIIGRNNIILDGQGID